MHGRKRQRGSTLIEFAIGMTMLVTAFGGVFQFGWSLLIYNNLLTSVTNAAIMAAQRDFDQSSPTSFTNDVKNMVMYGDLTARTTKVAPGLLATHINVTLSPNSTTPRYVTVSISGYQISNLFRSITLTNKPRVTVPFAGRIQCSSCT